MAVSCFFFFSTYLLYLVPLLVAVPCSSYHNFIVLVDLRLEIGEIPDFYRNF